MNKFIRNAMMALAAMLLLLPEGGAQTTIQRIRTRQAPTTTSSRSSVSTSTARSSTRTSSTSLATTSSRRTSSTSPQTTTRSDFSGHIGFGTMVSAGSSLTSSTSRSTTLGRSSTPTTRATTSTTTRRTTTLRPTTRSTSSSRTTTATLRRTSTSSSSLTSSRSNLTNLRSNLVRQGTSSLRQPASSTTTRSTSTSPTTTRRTSTSSRTRSSTLSRRNTFGNSQSIAVTSFEVGASSLSLPADGRSTATLVAYLADFDGNPLPNEIVRFTIVQGTGTLEETELGTDVGVDRLAVLNSRANRLSRSAPLTAQAVQATSLGDGRYVARYQAGTTGEPVIIEAAWVSTAQTALPAAQLVIDLRSPAALSVFVDDDSLPALGGEEATIIAYLEDGDGRPVDGARVTFNVIAGTGEIIPASELGIAQSGGRYAAVYRAGGTAGVTTIQVSVVDADVLLSETVQIELREVNRLEALAFPNVVQRLGGATSSSFERPIRLENTATIVVAVRDSDGDLVRGLGPRDLIAEVATGPGSVTNMSEIASPTGEGTGVYYTTYVASRAEDMATVLMTNLAATGNPQASVQVQTVSTIGSTGGIASDLFLVAFTDDLYDAGSSSPPSLLTALVSNSDGNPVDGLVPDVTVLQGVGATSREMVELPNLATGGGSGVYVAGYLAASVATTQDTTVRARAQSLNGPTVIADQIITIDPVLEPIAVVFPPLLPGDASSLATIDVFNLNDIVPDDLRYQVNITGGTGRILFQPNNSGENGDLIAGDLIATGVYQAGAGSIVTSLEVTDTDAAGLPAVLADVSVGAPTTLTVFAFPGLARLSQSIALDIFATDQFGNSLSGHTIRVDVVRGSALVSNGGLAVDDGLGVGLVQDAYANDGVYVAEVITSSVVAGPVLLRITDTTDRLQPVVEVTADVF